LARHSKSSPPRVASSQAAAVESAELRIIGGSMRGRKLLYSGDRRTRPMKDRVREALFNLVGPDVAGMQAVDLFAGTGALGLEALSRGANRATFIEQHFPTADQIRQNAAQLGCAAQCDVLGASAFIWARRPTVENSPPWIVFCSPPYAFYADRRAEMLALIREILQRAPTDSMLVVESDSAFEPRELPEPDDWNVRAYPPAVVALYRKSPRAVGPR
jgi:16S rRNA (guanine966-N2)-methyltransferase